MQKVNKLVADLHLGARAGLKPDEWAKFMFVQILNGFMPIGIAKLLAGPLAYLLVTHVRRKVIKVQVKGQAKELKKQIKNDMKDPEKLRQAFIKFANVEVS